MADWVSGKIINVQHWTDELFSLTVQAPIAPFSAGQFTKLGLEIDGERVQRAYSYVNAPNNRNLEFYLIKVSQGKLSPKLHAMQPGNEIMLTKESAGYFVLNEIPTCQTLWMFATGTAIGPYLSILQQGEDLQRFENLVLVHAVRNYKDLSYLPLMQKLQQQYAGKLRIQAVVSREVHPQALHGRIPTLINSGELEASVGLNIAAASSHVMLCGNPDMVRDTTQLLKEQRQMQKHLRRSPGQITTELYW